MSLRTLIFGEKEKLFFAKEIEIKDFADIVYNLFILRKLTIDKEGKEQCSSGRLRSIIDCKAICEGYNIKGNITKAIKLMYNRYLHPNYCPNVRRIVHSGVGNLERIREFLEGKQYNFKVNG